MDLRNPQPRILGQGDSGEWGEALCWFRGAEAFTGESRVLLVRETRHREG